MPDKVESERAEARTQLSIIIPAHNEEAVIGRCLRTLLDGLDASAEILVCVNGCTDRTAEVAASFDRVKVVDVPVASKPAALNAGDRAAKGRVKVFMDADIVVSGRDVVKVMERLEKGPELVAAPRIRVDSRSASWAVRAYYAVWMKTPYVNVGMVGSGFYAFSASGRARFGDFPNIVGDDTYVRILYAPEERAIVGDAHFTVFPPTTLAALIDIETRRKAGYDEINDLALLPTGKRPRETAQTRALARMALNPSCWASLGVYGLVKVVSRLRYRMRKRAGQHRTWSRDETSRRAT